MIRQFDRPAPEAAEGPTAALPEMASSHLHESGNLGRMAQTAG